MQVWDLYISLLTNTRQEIPLGPLPSFTPSLHPSITATFQLWKNWIHLHNGNALPHPWHLTSSDAPRVPLTSEQKSQLCERVAVTLCSVHFPSRSS